MGWSPFCLCRHLDAVDLSVVAGRGVGGLLERVGEDVEGRKEGKKDGKEKEGKEETWNRCFRLVRSIHAWCVDMYLQ